MSSTALRISVLVASRRTRKVYWLWFCIASEVFSVTCGAIRTLISCSRFISWPPESLEALLDQLHRAHRHQHLVVGCERRSEEHTSELQSRLHLVCRLLL